MSATPKIAEPESPIGLWRTPNNAVLHYATELTLRPNSGKTLSVVVTEFRGILRAWCAQKMHDPGAIRWLSGSGFLSGGQWRKPREVAVGLRTELAGEAAAPEAWALFVQEKQTDGSFRRLWHTDVTLKRDADGGYRMWVSVSYSLDHGYLGWEPPLPEPTAPRIVRACLEAKSFSVRTGSLKVGKGLLTVSPKEAHLLEKIIFDPRRNLPVILITGDPNPFTFPVDAVRLHRALLGTCYVVATEAAPGWGEAWRDALPDAYLPRMNSVRVYQPGADASRPGDAARHRFFWDEDIRKHGFEEFIRMLQHGLVSRFSAPSAHRFRSAEDVVALRSHVDFEQHRARLKTTKEEAAFFLDEHGKVTERLRLCENLLQDSDQQRELAERERDSAKADADHLRTIVEDLKRDATAGALSPAHREHLERMCNGDASPADCLATIELLYPDAVIVLASARRSAAAAAGFQDVDSLKEQLFKLATSYHAALARGDGDQTAKVVFGHNEYTAKESNLSLAGRRARIFHYNGQQIFMERHLKIGIKRSDAATLRTHFHWDHQTQKVVIGHCGPHLTL